MSLICVVTHLFPLAGEVYRGRAIYETLRALRSYADVRVLYPQAQYPGKAPHTLYTADMPAECVCYPAIPMLSRPFNGDRCARALYRHLEKLHCDLILGYWLYPEGYATVEIAKGLNKRVVVGARGSDLRRIADPFTRRMVAKTVTDASSVLTVSEDLRQLAIAAGASPERTRTVLNGCDHAVFRYADRSAARRLLKVAEDAQVILYVGRLVAAKGVLDLLAAFAALSNEHPRLQMVWLGAGPLARRIESFAGRHGLRGRIHNIGVKAPDGVAQWMQAADVLCLPSYSEGCPNVVLEAASCGCPVVAADVGGVGEVLSPEFGLLVPPGDPTRLAEALRTALCHNWDRKAVSVAFTRTWDDVAKETYEVCRDLMAPVRPVRKMVSRSRPLKVTVVTPYFPTSENSYRGHAAWHTLQHLKELTEVEVICPLTAYPRAFRSRVYDPPDLTYRPPGLRTSYFEYPAIPLLTRPLNGLVCERYLNPYLLRSQPDIILNYWLYPEGYAAVCAGHALGVPVIVGSIGSDLRRIPDRITRALVRRTVTGADAVITVSEELRRLAIAMGVAPGRVTTILNGCDTSVFYPRGRDEARRVAGCEPRDEVVLYVGNMIAAKGLRELVQAFAALARSRPNARLVVAGQGPYRAQMEQQAADAGMQERVRMIGQLPSSVVADWMRAADVFCLPSHTEGSPNVIMEALSCGRPVVATDVGGIPELVNERCGILVPPQQPAALAAALDAALSKNWDTAVIAAVFNRGWKQVAEDLFAVCKSVLERARGMDAAASTEVASSTYDRA